MDGVQNCDSCINVLYNKTTDNIYKRKNNYFVPKHRWNSLQKVL
jgi:hypothetical protein